MRFGKLTARRTTILAVVTATAAFAALPFVVRAQAPYGGQYGPQQAMYSAPSRGPSYTDAYGNQMIVPAGFCQQCGNGGGGCGGCGNDCGCYGGGCNGGCNGGCYGPGQCGGGGFNSSMPMGAGGTDPPVGYELMNDAGVEGEMSDQRGPHYFDVRMEAVYLHRDETFTKDIDFTAFNVGNVVVLNSKELDFDDQPGFRLIGRYDICPLAVVEFGYTGIFGWETSASVNDPTNNLYSLWSRPSPGTGLFGTSPIGVNLPGGPNPESERASRQTISADSDLQSAEISYRRYWLGYSPRISGTLLGGFRYTRLDDNFLFKTQGSEPASNQPLGPLAGLHYNEDCENNLAGFQTGGDIWISLMQGLRIGSEGKVGLYNNHYALTNRITTTPPNTTPPTLTEKFQNDHAAFLTEGSVDVVADILPSLSIRVGYEVLFMNSLVLAGDNFNQISPYGNQGTRTPFVEDDGTMLYHGAHAGIEYIW